MSPGIIGLSGGGGRVCSIKSESDNICVVTIPGEGKIDAINLQYGEQSGQQLPPTRLLCVVVY